jgi:hypothetical protein
VISAIIILLTLVVMVSAELFFGRSPFPEKIKLWGGSKESSLQIFDWYTPSHIIHGFIFYLCGYLWLAILLEAVWEVIENSPLVINYYRGKTGYTGDTILNSLSDILCVAFGFTLCLYVPYTYIVLIAVTMELLTLWAVSDNLTLNILMFIYPFKGIKEWQMRRTPS